MAINQSSSTGGEGIHGKLNSPMTSCNQRGTAIRLDAGALMTSVAILGQGTVYLEHWPPSLARILHVVGVGTGPSSVRIIVQR